MLVETNRLIYKTFDCNQYSHLAIRYNIFRFSAINSKTNLKLAFHCFVELVETNPLMYNIKDFGYKRSPAIRLKIVVHTESISECR